MMEIILIRATVDMYMRQLVCLRSLGDVVSLVTVNSVCTEWYNIIGRSKHSRKIIRKTLRKSKVFGAVHSYITLIVSIILKA